MAICPYSAYYPNSGTRTPFPAGAPFGIVLHRTCSTNEWGSAENFRSATHYPHFMIGKTGPDRSYGKTRIEATGGMIQYQDTLLQAAHMRGENAKYLGIEFQSQSNLDPLTDYQLQMGRLLIAWLCEEHSINKYGPPPNQVVKILNRSFHGVLCHADIQMGKIPGAQTNHGDAISKDEFVALGIEPYPLLMFR